MGTLKHKVLIVDDEKDICELVGITLMRMKEKVEVAYGVSEAKNKLSKEKYSLVLTDMRMPDGLGSELIAFMRKELGIDTPIAVITAYAKTEQAVEALKNGAFDYLQKPITIADLKRLVETVREMEGTANANIAHDANSSDNDDPNNATSVGSDSKEKNSGSKKKGKKIFPFGGSKSGANDEDDQDVADREEPKDDADPKVDAEFPRLLGTSKAITEVKEKIRKIAKKDIPIYITGESGTGKEQAARSIHEASYRSGKPFIAVNCGAIPETLMESEFFGYVKGSFTGANGDKVGFFQAADGGTLFLDEVADLPLNMQVKLLRAIQEKAVRRIGDQTENPVDVRLICATHKNLDKEVAMGRFRQDLYYRLNIVTLDMPPLRHIKNDLDLFVANTLKKIEPHRKIKISTKAKKALAEYPFPGNFRELENVLMRASALCENDEIQVDDLMLKYEELAKRSHGEKASSNVLDVNLSNGNGELETRLEFRIGASTLGDMTARLERSAIEKALGLSNGDEEKAADLLGISVDSLKMRM